MLKKWLHNGVIALPLIVFFMLCLFFYAGLHKDPRALPSALIGKTAPKFSAQSLIDQHVITEKQFKDHITLLNVWASWCYPCRDEHRVLLNIERNIALKKRYHLQVVGISYKDQQGSAKKMLNQLGNPFDQVIVDPHGLLSMNLGVYGTPETFIIDQKGVVRYRYAGALTTKLWRKELLPLIKQCDAECQHAA